MRKQFYLFIVLAVLGLIPINALAQTVNTSATVTWPFSAGTTGQKATYSGSTADYFTTDYVSTGAKLPIKDYNLWSGITFTRVQPTEQLGGASADGTLAFHLMPKNGLTFLPTAISFDCVRYGTNGGSIDVIWRASDGTATTLATGMRPNRNDNGVLPTHATYDLSALTIPASSGDCSLELSVYALGNTKQNGFANVVITGNVVGTPIILPSYTVSVVASPAEGGTVGLSPNGSSFDEGTPLTATATRNFGYAFSHWANGAGESVSTDNTYAFNLTANTALTAVFTKLNTYSLTTAVTGGAKDYMVSALPAGTKVGDLLMYEEGTSVTLSAKSNPIMTFTNWATGETTADLTLTMNQNQSATAVYSASDYIVGWDFYMAGNNGRAADFSSTTDNQASSLVLRNTAGTLVSWLDKSQIAGGGYEGAPAAVNWSPFANNNYYQASFVATDFTDIKVASAMLFNYNAYSAQKCEYSLDGTTFEPLDTITMSAAKTWYNSTYTLPAAANHAPKVYIRWIPDYTSAVVGTASSNDGTAISAIYVTGTAAIYNDGVAPVLQSSVPADNATGASASGKVVLTFDEKVQIVAATTATLGDKVLTPAVSGKTITFPYTGLDYNTEYTFTLSGNTVSDLAGNTQASAVTFKFTTLSRPTVTKKKFDFVVGVDGDFKAAIAAATAASATGNRFYIFFPNGEYNIGANTGDGNQMTSVSLPNVSYIGESADGVVVYNKSITESINSTATLCLTSTASNIYMQDISLMNKMDYRTGTLLGRGVVLWDQGTKNIYKNIKLLSNQDTYYTSGANRTYLENCEIHGTVDFICGGGDLFFNECLIYLEDRSGNVVTAPATSSAWGYVFSNCTIDGFAVNNGSYKLGRPWSNTPKCVFINTTMNVLPNATGWGDPMNVVPSVFAEYNSMTAGGAAVDLSGRRTTYTKDATTVTLNPVLTTEQAATYTVEGVLAGADTWLPKRYTDQATTPVIAGNGSTITWNDNSFVLCWAVCKNGAFVEFVTTNSYTVPDGTAEGAVYTVRAANEMGGLSAASNSYAYAKTSGVDDIANSGEIVEVQYFTIDGIRLESIQQAKGIAIVRTLYSNGKITVGKVLNPDGK